MTTHTSATHPIDDYGIPNLPTPSARGTTLAPGKRATGMDTTLWQRARDADLNVRYFPIINVSVPRTDKAAAFDTLIATCVATTYGDAPDDAIARMRRVQPLAVETRLREAYVGQFAGRVLG
jgi:hypothetical protein